MIDCSVSSKINELRKINKQLNKKMSNIRPDEVSSIIREQLSNFKSESELEEVGTILQVGDGVARIYGLSNAKAGEL